MNNKNKNIHLRKRIVRVFKEHNVEVLSTRQIKDKLSHQLTPGYRPKRYSRQPPITQLSNILKFYKEFERCNNDAVVKEYDGKTFKMATWRLTEEGEGLI